MKKIELSFEISEQDLILLNRIKFEGYAEFRDGTLEDYILREISRLQNDILDYEKFVEDCKKSFLTRNFCFDNELDNLVKYELVELNENSWHLTFKISDLGNLVFEQQNLETIKIKIKI